MVEQKRRTVHECPGDILHSSKPAYGGLLHAHFEIVAQSEEYGIRLNRPLGKLKLVAERLEPGIDREGHLQNVFERSFLEAPFFDIRRAIPSV